MSKIPSNAINAIKGGVRGVALASAKVKGSNLLVKAEAQKGQVAWTNKGGNVTPLTKTTLGPVKAAQGFVAGAKAPVATKSALAKKTFDNSMKQAKVNFVAKNAKK